MSFDPSSSQARYLPTTTAKIAFTSVASTWGEINSAEFPRYFTFVATQDCYLSVGGSNIAAPDDSYFMLPAGIHDFMVRPHEGIRVLRVSTDGVLKISLSGV